MRINMAIQWDQAPPRGRVQVNGGRLANALINVGWGSYEQARHAFTFTSTDEMCRITYAIDADAKDPDALAARVEVVDTPRPFTFALRDVLRASDGRLRLEEPRATVSAEVDAWVSLGSEAPSPSRDSEGAKPMGLPLYKGFTPEQIKQFGPIRQREVLRTERRVYTSPFMYENVDVGDFYEIDPTKGIELKANDGFIRIREDRPIVSVAVVGSGCVPGGYNICEWWDDGQTIDNMKDQLVKRQRIGHLDGTHPSIYSQLLMGTFPGLTFRDVTEGEIRTAAECLKKLTNGYYGGYYMGFWENVANFRVGPPYPKKVTIRAGTGDPEDPGGRLERYPGDYAIRVIETTVIV